MPSSSGEDTVRERLFATADVTDFGPPRDYAGYVDGGPELRWPDGSVVAVQVVVNYEEGSETSFTMGDGANETVLHDIANPVAHARDLAVESAYEYGSRAGVWRLLRIFEQFGVAVTFFATAVALQRNPRLAEVLAASTHEVAAHGFRWSSHADLPRELESEAIRRCVDELERQIGRRPVGWYVRKASPRTRALLVEIGGFLYDSNAFNDDVPYWVVVEGEPHLVVPYSMACNDVKFVSSPGYADPDSFLVHLRRTLDRLRRDGDGASRMMSIGLHPRLSGQPGRASAVADFIEYALGLDDVWVARRMDIATEFMRQVPAPTRAQGLQADDHRVASELGNPE